MGGNGQHGSEQLKARKKFKFKGEMIFEFVVIFSVHYTEGRNRFES